MKIKLLNPNDFANTKGTVLDRQLFSFNMKQYTTKLWSNGWCPCSVLKCTDDGHLIARISGELVPPTYYENITIDIPDNGRFAQSIQRKLNNRKEKN